MVCQYMDKLSRNDIVHGHCCLLGRGRSINVGTGRGHLGLTALFRQLAIFFCKPSSMITKQVVALLLSLLAFHPTWSDAESTTTKPSSETPLWKQSDVTTVKLITAIDDWKKALEELPKDTQESSPEGQRRLALKERVARLSEWKEIRERMSALHAELSTLVSEQREIA